MWRVRFILSEPSVPENVGAAARALITCGFHELALVAPAGQRLELHRDERARWLAVGAAQVLDGARVYSSLREAISGTDLVIGTTARHRSYPRPIIDSRHLRAFLAEKNDPSMYVALVFGNEQTGLRNEELALCNVVCTIPIAQAYPSLNLAQAVMVFAYEICDRRSQPRARQDGATGAGQDRRSQPRPAFLPEGRTSARQDEVPESLLEWYGATGAGRDRRAFLSDSSADDDAPPAEASLAAFLRTTQEVLALAGVRPEEGVHARLLEYAAHCNAHEMGAFYTLWRRLLARERGRGGGQDAADSGAPAD